MGRPGCLPSDCVPHAQTGWLKRYPREIDPSDPAGVCPVAGQRIVASPRPEATVRVEASETSRNAIFKRKVIGVKDFPSLTSAQSVTDDLPAAPIYDNQGLIRHTWFYVV